MKTTRKTEKTRKTIRGEEAAFLRSEDEDDVRALHAEKKRIAAEAKTETPRTRDERLAEISREYLKVETLKTRKSDDLDFHEFAVWTIREALLAAYEAGRKSAGR